LYFAVTKKRATLPGPATSNVEEDNEVANDKKGRKRKNKGAYFFLIFPYFLKGY
jgi:hypothetical protein